MKEVRLINRVSEKKMIRGNGSFWAPKLHIFITLDRLEEAFFRFSTMKRPNR